MNDLPAILDFICPQCGQQGMVDDDQLRGRVSIVCPKCGWHQTRDWTTPDNQGLQRELRAKYS